MLKGLFKNSNPLTQLILLALLCFVGAASGGSIGILIAFIKTGSLEGMEQVVQNLTAYPDLLREIQFFSSLGTFILPAFILGWLFSDHYKEYLRMETPSDWKVFFWTIVSMVVVLPFINFTSYYNAQLSFPEALGDLERYFQNQSAANRQLMEAILSAETWWALTMNIVVIAVFAGLGEELIFRGVMQNIFGRFLRNKHVVIWTVAVIFSLIHFDIYGFVPRTLLGAYFGYLLLFTGNIWVPVSAHLSYNLVIVLVARYFVGKPEMMERFDAIGTGSGWWIAVVSLSLFVFAFSNVVRFARPKID